MYTPREFVGSHMVVIMNASINMMMGMKWSKPNISFGIGHGMMCNVMMFWILLGKEENNLNERKKKWPWKKKSKKHVKVFKYEKESKSPRLDDILTF